MDTLSPAVAQPAHVPAAAVYDFDMFLDPLDHTRYRAPLNPAFSPIAIDALPIRWD